MGDYFKLSNVQGLRESPSEPIEHDKGIKSFFKQLKVVSEDKQSSSISHLALNNGGDLCAVSSGTKAIFYDYKLNRAEYNFTSAKDFVRCCSFREDSKLAAVSDDSGNIHILALPLKSLLKGFKAHNGSIYCHSFSSDKGHLMTGGDDGTVKFWDIQEEKSVLSLEGHTDRVRSLCDLSENSFLWATGCYDCTCRIYDIRCPQTPVSTLQHDAPIESVTSSKSCISMVVSGGTLVKIWDLSSGLKLKSSLQPHMRTIFRAYLSEDQNCIVTASLDGTIKFTENSSKFPLMHVYTHESAVSAFDYSLSGNTMASGLSTGKWLIRHNSSGFVKSETSSGSTLQLRAVMENNSKVSGNITSVTGYKTVKLGVLDRLVKAFQYQAALDLALTLTPDHVYNLVELLILRGSLGTAVKGRDEQTIIPLLKFVSSQLNRDVYNTSILLEFLHTVLDNNTWLKTCSDATVIKELRKIPSKINLELYQHTILLKLQGMIDLILT
ncbi:WD domain, G-beta repeat family protein [Theileria equi strain WA]|uniref:WD domain, G-beta repeat family protein n=1 Tax=Theileria equi strain WA TaxID=1537102 RepID=L1LFR8_THEEQ|nr:WD domain, G-beta repeat family protein [Theileria equi strain WA]EKX74201.1 WD domain, G-beta repeat family protein [Theileria equi strain WA]|eukprot:XP_004833653.1 WD domain, G-beta repeat family protein [Theileria equi strain WA]